MNGIASLLDHAANGRVETIWRELESRCGLKGIRVTPFPHFTWQVTEGYNLPQLEKALWEFSKEAQPFTIHTDGLGLFTSERPVAYISIYKDEHLANLHAKLWEIMKEFAIQPDLFYSPARWVPHITLAYNDLTSENIGCVMQALAFQSHDLEIKIDNLIYISQSEGQTIAAGRYQLGAG
jgi:2'-5' RNA ligase